MNQETKNALLQELGKLHEVNNKLSRFRTMADTGEEANSIGVVQSHIEDGTRVMEWMLKKTGEVNV